MSRIQPKRQSAFFWLIWLMAIFPITTTPCASTESFISYLKCVENANKKGYVDGKWYTHMVLGVPHIGYGHKLKGHEEYPEGLTDEEVEMLLQGDIEAAANQCAKEIPRWNSLNQKQREMLTDFAFNIGTTRTHPKFVRAVIANNEVEMRSEYKRYATYRGKRIELRQRNKMFYSTFLR